MTAKTTNIAEPGSPAILGKRPQPVHAHPLRIFWRGRFPLDLLRRLRIMPRTESDSRVLIRSLDSEVSDGHSADFVKFHKAHAPRLFAERWDPSDAVSTRAHLFRHGKLTRIDALDMGGNIIRAWEFEEPAGAAVAEQTTVDEIFGTADTQKIPHEVRR